MKITHNFLVAPIALAMIAVLSLSAPAQEIPIAIPLKPDPLFVIDGDLEDWQDVPSIATVNTEKHATYNGAHWKGADDLSATVYLAWRRDALYIAADVTDDAVKQAGRGASMWEGDHIELYLDLAPQDSPEKSTFGARQFYIAINPGNFQDSGDSLTDIPAEIYGYLPDGLSIKGDEVASLLTDHGYTIEASIPWTNFEFEPRAGISVGIEIAISDTDSDQPAQEKMMTLGTSPWKRIRSRLLPATFANADGEISVYPNNTSLPIEASVEPQSSQTFTFDAPPLLGGYEVILALKGRMQRNDLKVEKTTGYSKALHLVLNGKIITPERLFNKEAGEKIKDGRTIGTFAGNIFTVPSAPNFEAMDKHPTLAMINGNSSLLEFRVTDLLKEKGNTLIVSNDIKKSLDRTLLVGEASLQYRSPQKRQELKAPPTGKLSKIMPRSLRPVPYTIQRGNTGNFRINFNKSTFTVSSQYSTPAGKWETASNSYFTTERTIEQKDNWIIIKDVFTNLTDDNLPLIHRNEIDISPEKVWLSGVSPNNVIGVSTNVNNPTVFATQGNVGIGILPLDDVFQVHNKVYSTKKFVGLADENLVIKPKSTYTAEWAIVLIESTDNFDFINTTRRLLDVNFLIDGSFAFLRANDEITQWSDQKLTDFVRYKDAKFISLKNLPPHSSSGNYKGGMLQGTDWQDADHRLAMAAIARRRKLLPTVKQLRYFHSFLDSSDDAPERFKDSRILLANGKQGNYANPYMNLFVPTLKNSWGKAIGKSIDIIFDDLKLDGVYWDQPNVSRYDYTYNSNEWDGFSADIDSKTMKIKQLKSSVALLSLPWRLQTTKKILNRGTLILNDGASYTRSMRELLTKYRIPAFVETGTISKSTRAQFYTPIGLGDHHTERNTKDAYHNMIKLLDYGIIYYWYDEKVIPEYHTLTQYMFPITPIELHEGYIIGKERIITNRSGIFGWDDSSKHEIHVYDNTGREVNLKDVKSPAIVKTRTEKGKNWTEVRIGEQWSVVIVRTEK